MAFIPLIDLPKDALVEKQFKLKRPFRNMGGLFTAGTVMKCLDVSIRGGVTLEDDAGNKLRMNKTELSLSSVML
jgi:hypothetical protein